MSRQIWIIYCGVFIMVSVTCTLAALYDTDLAIGEGQVWGWLTLAGSVGGASVGISLWIIMLLEGYMVLSRIHRWTPMDGVRTAEVG